MPRRGTESSGHQLSKSYLLVKHLDDCRPFADEIAFYQRARKQLTKVKTLQLDLDHVVHVPSPQG